MRKFNIYNLFDIQYMDEFDDHDKIKVFPEMLANSSKLTETGHIQFPKSDDNDINSYKKSEHEHNHDDKHDDEHHGHDDEDDEDGSVTVTKEDTYKQKMEMIYRLGELKREGIPISQNYTMSSSLKAMKYEYELWTNQRNKKNVIDWASGLLVGTVKGLELLNDYYVPFGTTFDFEWSNDVYKNIQNYYSIIGEIYDKYVTPGKQMSPELRLCLTLVGSAIMIQVPKFLAKHMPPLVPDQAEDIDPEHYSKLREQAQNERSSPDLKSGGAPIDPETKKRYEETKQQVRNYNEALLSKTNIDKLENQPKTMSTIKQNLRLSSDSQTLDEIDATLNEMKNEGKQHKKIPRPKKKHSHSSDEDETTSTVTTNPDVQRVLSETHSPKKEKKEKKNEKSSFDSKNSEKKSRISIDKTKGLQIVLN